MRSEGFRLNEAKAQDIEQTLFFSPPRELLTSDVMLDSCADLFSAD